MAFQPVYKVGSGLYINLTNACQNACVFCVRDYASAVGEAESLWLDHEPTAQETLERFRAMMAEDVYTEAVFCGFGEPTLRLEALLAVAEGIKKEWPALSVRLNTNGQGSLEAGRDITPELAGVVDCVSISLNAATAEEYVRVCRPAAGETAFGAMLAFAQAAQAAGMETILSIVEGETDESACRVLLAPLGLKLRVRAKIEG